MRWTRLRLVSANIKKPILPANYCAIGFVVQKLYSTFKEGYLPGKFNVEVWLNSFDTIRRGGSDCL